MEDRAAAHTGASVAVSMTIAMSRGNPPVPADGCSCYSEAPSPTGGEASGKARGGPALRAWERMNARTHAELANFIWSICNLLRGP